MARRLRLIELRSLPNVLRLADEVRTSDEPCVLALDGEAIAVLTPLPTTKRRRAMPHATSDTAFEAFRSAAGGWSEIDTDRLLHDIYADRDCANH